MKKKIVSLILTLALCLGLTVPAFAEESIHTVYLNGYDTSDGLTGVKEGSMVQAQVDLTVKGTLKQVDTGLIRDFTDSGDFTYPVYEAPASGVVVTVWNYDWFHELYSWIESAVISKVSYDMTSKSYTVLQENAVQWNESPLEVEESEFQNVPEGTWVHLTEPGTYLIDIRCAVIAGGCIAVVIIPPSESEKPVNPDFTDVNASDYFADAVQWAVEKNITSGTSKTTFSPGATCSKAQILTFLWRANGSPDPAAANPFTDVKTTDYFYKAALWAAEKGLVSGSIFGANTDCTRAMTMEYMWKAAGSPTPAGTADFTDVPGNSDYAQAVAWAVENEITSGTGGSNFSPAATCTRGQIVTFLHRAMGK